MLRIALGADHAGQELKEDLKRYVARMTRGDNDASVPTLGPRLTDPAEGVDIFRVWMQTEFAGGRHQRRPDRIVEIERRWAGEEASE